MRVHAKKIKVQKAAWGRACLFYIITNLSAAFEHYPSDPVAAGTGLLTVNINANAVGVFADPASVTTFHNRHINISSGRRFGLQLLQHYNIAVAQPIKKGFIAAGINFIGDELYSETTWCLVAGLHFMKKIKVGMGLMYYDLQIKNYGQAGSLGMNIGWRIILDESLHWIGSWRNVNGPTIGSSQDEIPQIIVSALVYNPISKATVVLEWEQDTLYDSRVKVGGKFKFLPWFTIHTGHVTSPSQATIGFEILINHLNINYAVSTHSHLDLSHWFGVGFSFR